MKTKVFFAFVMAAAFGLTSCTQKIDEKTIGEIQQFGTEWTSLGEKATAWSQELQTSAEQAKTFANQQNELVAASATMKDEATKTKIAEVAKMANEDASKFDGMLNEWNAFKATWDETTTQYSEWNDKVTKGEIKPADAIKGLNDFKTKMSDAQARMDSWSNTYAEVKSSCDQNMAIADEMAKTITAPVKK